MNTHAEFFARPRRPVSLVLDDFKIAFNVGTLLRLADTLLIKQVYLCGSTITPPNHKLKTGSRGAERWVPWSYCQQASEIVATLKQSGCFIIAAELTADSVPYTQAAIPSERELVLVLGREQDGVSPEVLSLADRIVHLPMHGMAKSLNVCLAAAVLLYDIERQLQSI